MNAIMKKVLLLMVWSLRNKESYPNKALAIVPLSESGSIYLM